MGICSSCLGPSFDRDLSDEDESSRLLFDDAHPSQYGSFGDPNTGIIQADPQEVQRETEALQKVVAQTSNHLVDIFAMIPQNVPPRVPATMFTGQDARLLRYQDVLAKMSIQDASSKAKQSLVDDIPHATDGWASDEDSEEEMKSHKSVKSEDVGPLLGGFADADSTLR